MVESLFDFIFSPLGEVGKGVGARVAYNPFMSGENSDEENILTVPTTLNIHPSWRTFFRKGGLPPASASE